MVELAHFLAPQADFASGPECFQKCQDWVEECELLLSGPLSTKNNAVKANYVMIWAGKTGRTHIKSLNLSREQRADPKVLLAKFIEWTKPKSNALAAAANFRRLEQGSLSLVEYIDKATVLCDQYCFDHITSSPCYPQSNGLIERMVQTVKQCLKKSAEAGQDPNLGMLVYRATPLSAKMPSPAEFLNGRKYRALLPTRSLMQNAHGQIVREQMIQDKNKSTDLYNRSAKDLPVILQHNQVYVQIDPKHNRWIPAVVTKTPSMSQPRSYSVETTDGAQWQRNRCFINPATQPTTTATRPATESSSSISDHPSRVIRKPSRLIETM